MGTKLFVMLAVALAGFGFATPTYDLSGLATTVTDDVTSVFTQLLPVLIAIIALVVGWKYIRRVGRGL